MAHVHYLFHIFGISSDRAAGWEPHPGPVQKRRAQCFDAYLISSQSSSAWPNKGHEHMICLEVPCYSNIACLKTKMSNFCGLQTVGSSFLIMRISW